MDGLEQKTTQQGRLYEIAKNVGFALWQIQVLEEVSAKFLVLLTQSHKGMGIEAGNLLEKAAMSKTFGATIHKLIKADLLGDDLKAKFEKLLSERNWLVHRSRENNRHAIYSDKATQALITQLEDIADDVLILSNVSAYGTN